MATLLATVRRLTGALIGDVPDADVVEALAAHRVREQDVPIVWERVMSAGVQVYTRGRFMVWGDVEPSTQATAATNLVVIAQSDGTAPTGNYALEQDGTIVFASDQAAAPTLYLSAYSHDVNLACADVTDQLVGLCAGDYDVKLGDQTFSRSQGVASLKDRAAAFRRKALPSRSAMMLTRLDEEPSPIRKRRRQDWR